MDRESQLKTQLKIEFLLYIASQMALENIRDIAETLHS